MADPIPIACSLDADRLRGRLADIEAIGAEGLIEHARQGDRHMLRFRADAETERRLRKLIAAEAECCSFLILTLEARDDELLFSVTAPQSGQPVADELAAAFAAGSARAAARPGPIR
jgi:hypothetical protein